ncbi:unnamed protein product [Rangifer tarandus platyrhynchus]|uniref:Uncharacterized protein n=1 Tax=Rangifer tarandus platyrhynchus TaxID=3082113 RepID=A0AC59YCE5_RANTA
MLAGSPSPNPALTHAAGPAPSQRALPGLPPAISEADAPEEQKRDDVAQKEKSYPAQPFPLTSEPGSGLSWGRE